jgi:hypothetical protein
VGPVLLDERKGFAPSSLFYLISQERQETSFRLKRMATLIIIVGIWGVLASGCTWAWSRDTIVRCPKCSTAFTIEDYDIHMEQLTR